MNIHKYTLICLFCASILVSSCSPIIYDIAVDIRRPAETAVNMEEKSIAIYVDPYERENSTVRDSILNVSFASGIASRLEEYLALSEEAVYIYNHYPSRDSLPSMEYIQSLSRQADSDIVILVDSVSISDFSLLENVALTASHDVQYMYALFESKISVYDGVTAETIAKVNQKDTVYWELLSRTDLRIASSPEGITRVISLVAPKVGADVASRFFPKWVTEYRYLYIYGGASWNRAYNYAQAFEWDKAIEIWLAEVGRDDKYRAACAAVNIAVGCEMTDRPELALEWLESAEKLHDPQRLGLSSYKLRLTQEIEKRKKEQAAD